ncbi:MAG TPA: translation elongation factor Ts [Bacilli bacterium]|jgi:elongation factor Ts|nr:translation elongation factor Ts [Bacilli bacterium]
MISAKQVNELREKTGAGMMDCKKALTACNGDIEASIDWLREKGISKAAKKADRIAAEGLANIFIDGNKASILEVNCETDFVTRNQEFVDMVNTIGNAILTVDSIKSNDDVLNIVVDGKSISELITDKTAKIGEKLSLRRAELVNKSDDESFGSYLHMGGKIASLVVVKGASEDVAKDVAMQAAAMRPLYLNSSEVPAEILEKEKEVLKEQAINEGKPEDIAEKMVLGRISKYYKENCLVDQEFVKDSSMDIKTYVKNNGGEVVSMIRYEVGEGMEHRNENLADEVAKQLGN